MSISISSECRIGIVRGEELIDNQRVSILVDVNDGQQAMAPPGIVTGTFVAYTREEEKRDGGGADQSTPPKFRASKLTGLANGPIVCTFVIDGRPRTGVFAQLCENVLDAELTQNIFGPQIRLLFQKFFSESGTGTVMAIQPEQSKGTVASPSNNGCGVKAASATATTTANAFPSAHVDPTAKVPQHTESGNTTVPSANATVTSAPSNNASIAQSSSSQAAPASVPAAVPANPTRASFTDISSVVAPTSRPPTAAISQPSTLLREAHQKRLHDLKHDQENKREKRVEAALLKMGGWDRNPLSVQNLRVLEGIAVECPIDVISGDAVASKAPFVKAAPHSVYTRSNGATSKSSGSQPHGGGMYHNSHHTPFTVSGGGAAAGGVSSTGLRQPYVPSSSSTMPLPPPPAAPPYGQQPGFNPMLRTGYPGPPPFPHFQPSPYAVPFSVMPIQHVSAATGGGGGGEFAAFGSVGIGTKTIANSTVYGAGSYGNDNDDSFVESRVVGSELERLLEQTAWNDDDVEESK